MTSKRARTLVLLAAALLSGAAAPLAVAAAAPAQEAAPALTYADLAALADGATAVVRVRVRSQAVVPPERAPGLASGRVRLFVEAQTLAVLSGRSAVPEAVRYLVDVPGDARGRPPKLTKREFVVFARPVAGRPSELQLVGPHAQLPYTADLAARLPPVLRALAAADAPPRVTGVRDAASSAGTLAGESETQIFLATAGGEPAALTVVRRPGLAPRWGVSWGELIDQAAAPAAPGTLAWFRLACALPPALPASATAGADPADQARAAEDYRFVLADLGTCDRTLG